MSRLYLRKKFSRVNQAISVDFGQVVGELFMGDLIAKIPDFDEICG